MNELIKITEKDGMQLVSANDLYVGLGYNKAHWAKWYKKNILSNGFAIEFEDYTQLTPSVRSLDFALTLDFAKRLSMLARTEKGEKIRGYFILCEKIAKEKNSIDFNNPDTVLQLAQNWKDEKIKREAFEKQNALLAPKAELMDRVMDCEDKIDIGQVSKVLGLDFGRNTMFKKLRDEGVLFKNRNEPKQSFVDRGYFVLKQKLIQRTNNPDFIVLKVLVTQKGLAFLGKMFNASNGSNQLARLN